VGRVLLVLASLLSEEDEAYLLCPPPPLPTKEGGDFAHLAARRRSEYEIHGDRDGLL
jgi:hypothetical protein